MKTIRYSRKNNDFTTELRNAVKGYFVKNDIEQYGNKEIIVKTICMTLAYFVPYGMLVAGGISSLPLLFVLWIMMGLGMSGLGMVTMHDANHGSFSKSDKVNKIFSKSLYVLGGFPPNWKFQHNTLHHGFTNIEGHDEDIAPTGALRFSPHQPLKKIHRFQYIYAWFFYSLMTISWITLKDFKRLANYKKMGAKLSGNKNYNRLFAELLVSKMFYYGIFLVVPILTIQVSWFWTLTGFILMHLESGLILSTIFQTAHVVPTSVYPLPNGDGELNNNWAAHQLYTTSDFAPNSKIFSWFIGGLNYQVEHHLFPNISHIHYRHISVLVKDMAVKYGLPYHVDRNFLHAIKQHTKMLKLLGNDKQLFQTGLVTISEIKQQQAV